MTQRKIPFCTHETFPILELMVKDDTLQFNPTWHWFSRFQFSLKLPYYENGFEICRQSQKKVDRRLQWLHSAGWLNSDGQGYYGASQQTKELYCNGNPLMRITRLLGVPIGKQTCWLWRVGRHEFVVEYRKCFGGNKVRMTRIHLSHLGNVQFNWLHNLEVNKIHRMVNSHVLWFRSLD